MDLPNEVSTGKGKSNDITAVRDQQLNIMPHANERKKSDGKKLWNNNVHCTAQDAYLSVPPGCQLALRSRKLRRKADASFLDGGNGCCRCKTSPEGGGGATGITLNASEGKPGVAPADDLSGVGGFKERERKRTFWRGSRKPPT